MKWTEREIEYLKENYSKRIPMEYLSKKLNKSVRAIQHKGNRLGIKRKRYKFNLSKQPRTEIDKRHYDKNKEKINQRKYKRVAELRKELKMIKGGKCSKCGYKKSFAALEFHHTHKNKESNISNLIKDYSKQKALKEIEKCILLCANCHREHHHGSVVY